jgi:hypothetical protein
MAVAKAASLYFLNAKNYTPGFLSRQYRFDFMGIARRGAGGR